MDPEKIENRNDCAGEVNRSLTDRLTEIEEMQVSHQSARIGAVKHGISKRNPIFLKPLPSSGYVKIQQSMKT
jgi:hypothetical protein